MDKKLIALFILLAVASMVWAFVAVGKRHARTHQLDNSSIVQSYAYRCQSCGEVFEMDFAEMRRHVKKGNVVSPPNQSRLFPCPKCEKIEAVRSDNKYAAPTPQQQNP